VIGIPSEAYAASATVYIRKPEAVMCEILFLNFNSKKHVTGTIKK